MPILQLDRRSKRCDMTLCCQTQTINAECSWTPEHGLMIKFSDPSYLRSDYIIYSRSNAALSVIVHEGEFLMGNIDDNLTDLFEREKGILLTAIHVNGTALHRKVPISIN